MRRTSVKLEEVMPIIKEQLALGKNVKFTPKGTSMRPMLIGERDQVVLSPLPGKLKKYDLPLYQRDDGAYVLHRISKVGDTYTCIGDNQYIYEPNVRHDQMIGLVTAFVHNGKRYKVTDISYRIYSVLWCNSRYLRRALGYIYRHIFRR